MLFRPLLALAFGCVFSVIVAPSAVAQTARGNVDGSTESRDVRAWLMRIHSAAGQRNFQGTFVVSGGGAVSSARIAHYCEGASQFERIESMDGEARHVFRHNEVVHTLWPQSRVALVEQRALMNSFPGLLSGGDDGIAEWYDVRPQGADRVAGHEANVLLLQPRDGLRFGYRLWSDKASGLLLRSDVLDDRGNVVETSAFSEVTIGVRSQPETVLQPMKKLDGYRIVKPNLLPTKLEAEGWVLRHNVPGFKQVSCVKRSMSGLQTSPSDPGAVGPQALQAIYSDGLTYVSVFIEPFNLERHGKPVVQTVGATHTMMNKQGDAWVTVVGDVPAGTLRAFAAGLERKR